MDGVVRYAMQLAYALDAAHQRGIVQRDFKSAKIVPRIITMSGARAAAGTDGGRPTGLLPALY